MATSSKTRKPTAPARKPATRKAPMRKPAARKTAVAKAGARPRARLPARAPAKAYARPSVAAHGAAADYSPVAAPVVAANPGDGHLTADRPKKIKLVRDNLTISKSELLMLRQLKQRLGKVGATVKKSEILRAGIMALAAMNDAALAAALAAVPAIKTGRPKKD